MSDTWYAVYEVDGGKLRTDSTTEPVLSDPSLAFKPFGFDFRDPSWQWDPETLDFVPVEIPKRVDPYDFKQRFTFEQRVALFGLAKTDGVVAAFLDQLNDPRLRNVYLDDPDTVAGVNYIASKIPTVDPSEILS